MTDFLDHGPSQARHVALLAHGAGAPMDSPFMNAVAAQLGQAGVRVLRFEFPYMAARRTQGGRMPPPRAETLCGVFEETIAAAPVAKAQLLFIGGKSMGGRVASLVADRAFRQGGIAGLVCLGYPFHPPGKPDKLRTAHLQDTAVPTLLCQGERDPFGTREEVPTFGLAPAIRLHWLADGNHDLAPRKASGRTARQNWDDACAAIAAFMRDVAE